MREAIVIAAVLAMIAGGAIGVAWRPWLSEYDNMLDDLTFCQADLSAERNGVKLARQRTLERDRAIADSEEWRKWYEDAHRDRAALGAMLVAAKSEIAALSFQRSAQAQQIVDLTTPKVKVAEIAPRKKRKPKLKKRKPVRVVYRWHLF